MDNTEIIQEVRKTYTGLPKLSSFDNVNFVCRKTKHCLVLSVKHALDVVGRLVTL